VYSSNTGQLFTINIYNVTTSGFSWRKAFAWTTTGGVNIAEFEWFNWIAIGY